MGAFYTLPASKHLDGQRAALDLALLAEREVCFLEPEAEEAEVGELAGASPIAERLLIIYA